MKKLSALVAAVCATSLFTISAQASQLVASASYTAPQCTWVTEADHGIYNGWIKVDELHCNSVNVAQRVDRQQSSSSACNVAIYNSNYAITGNTGASPCSTFKIYAL